MTTPTHFTAHRDRSQPAIERFEWLTALATGRDGTEHLEGPLRASPRMSYQWSIVLPPAADKSALAALRTADEFIAPLWPHAFQRPDVAPTAGIASTAAKVFSLSHMSAGTLMNADAFGWGAGHYIAAPAVRARFLEPSRSIAYSTSTSQSAPVAFLLVGFKESFAPYTGPSIDGVLSLAPFVAYWTQPSEQITVVEVLDDAGHVQAIEPRFRRRVFTLRVQLTTRAAVVEFRRFLLTLQGRLTPLCWAAPGEAVSTWRLDSDTVELNYDGPRTASCSLPISQRVPA